MHSMQGLQGIKNVLYLSTDLQSPNSHHPENSHYWRTTRCRGSRRQSSHGQAQAVWRPNYSWTTNRMRFNPNSVDTDHFYYTYTNLSQQIKWKYHKKYDIMLSIMLAMQIYDSQGTHILIKNILIAWMQFNLLWIKSVKMHIDHWMYTPGLS